MTTYTNGHLYIGMTEDFTLDMGVQKLNDSISVSIFQKPIVTYQAEDTFAYDVSAQDGFTITITRKNPDNAYDPTDDPSVSSSVTTLDGEDGEDAVDNARLSTDWNASSSPSFTWCNRLWKKALTSLINRWQMRTDGNRLTFIPVVTRDGTPNTEGVFQHRIENANVYLKSITFTYTDDTPEVITAQISMVMGSMSGKRQMGGI